MRRWTILAVAALVCVGAAHADDLTGVDRLLCSAGRVAICVDGVECFTAAPDELNVPRFVEVDLAAKRVKTTAASGENRATELAQVRREGGRIVLQGYENARAFSFVIEERTGVLTVAVATEGKSVAVFGACTPIPAR